MTVLILDNSNAFSDAKDRWDDLWRRSPQSDLFTSYVWLDAWWSAFHELDESLAIYCIERDGRFVAAIPLMRSPIHIDDVSLDGVPGPPVTKRVAAMMLEAAEVSWSRVAGRRRLRSVFNHYAGRSGILFDPDAAGALEDLFTALAAEKDRWDVIELDWIPEDLAAFAFLAGGGARDMRVHAVRTNESPYLPLDPAGFTHWYQKQFSSKTRSRDRVSLKEAAARPGYSLELVTGEAGEARVREVIEQVMDVETLGWKGETNSAMKHDARASRFIHDVAQRLARSGQLVVTLLHLDQRVIAFVLGFVARNTFYYFKTSFDPAYEELRPGRIVTTRTIEHAYSLGLTRFDFLGAADEYKMRYTRQVRPHAAVFLYHAGIRSSLFRMMKRSAVPLAKSLFGKGVLYPVRVDR